MSSGYGPVRVRSTFSFARGVSHVEDLVSAARAAGCDRIGLADRSSVSGHVRFRVSAVSAGILPMLGAELKLRWRVGPDELSGWVTVFAKTRTGFRNLSKLLSKVPLGGDVPVEWDDLVRYSQDVLILGGNATDGFLPVIALRRPDAVQDLCVRLKDVFGDRFYLEVERVPQGAGLRNSPGGTAAEHLLREPWFLSLGIPLIATTPVWFASSERREAWVVSRCMDRDMRIEVLGGDGNGGGGKERIVEPELGETACHILPRDEFERTFADLPEAIRNASEIFERCCYAPVLSPPSLPVLSIEGASPEDAIRNLCVRGLQARIAEHGIPEESVPEYRSRLDKELSIISKTGFASYFLIVSEYVDWARRSRIPVGPGRGSSVGSIAAWCLGITDIDPLEHGLLFERFLNPERVSPPDFDIDFCEERRGEVLRHLVDRYGADCVGSIATFAGIKAKTAIKDVAKILVHPDGSMLRFHEINEITKRIPNAAQVSSEDKDGEYSPLDGKAILEACERDSRIRTTVGFAKHVLGLYRQSGTHAAGVIIADSPITDRAPLHPAVTKSGHSDHEEDLHSSMPQIGFDMKSCEMQGMVKFDILGLAATTVLNRAEDFLRSSGEYVPNWSLADLDDPDIMRAFAAGDSVGVFQFESSGMQSVLKEVRPTRFSDLVAINALFRPGPMKYINEFAARKHGKRKISYPPIEAKTRPILEETYGIMVYQEQVMRIAQVCAGYSLGAADILRRAMGKKNPEEMRGQRKVFVWGDGKQVPGSVALGMTEKEANALFDDMAAFAGYGFNKSHAVAYTYIAWRMMWFKVNHPEVFYAALMSSKRKDLEDMSLLMRDAVQHGVSLLAPDIGSAGIGFLPTKDSSGKRCVMFSLEAVKGIGDASGFVRDRSALADRSREALADLVARHFTVKQIENLAAAGAFDSWVANRRWAFEILKAKLNGRDRPTQRRESVMADLFGQSESILSLKKELPEWQDREARELEVLGGYRDGHPILRHKHLFSRFGVEPLAEWIRLMRSEKLAEYSDIKLAAMIQECAVSQTRKGVLMLRITASETDNSYEAFVFERGDQKALDRIRTVCEAARKANVPVVLSGALNARDRKVFVRVDSVHTVSEVASLLPNVFLAEVPEGFDGISRLQSSSDPGQHTIIFLSKEDGSYLGEVADVGVQAVASLQHTVGVTVRASKAGPDARRNEAAGSVGKKENQKIWEGSGGTGFPNNRKSGTSGTSRLAF